MRLGYEKRDIAANRLSRTEAKYTFRCAIKRLNLSLVVDNYDSIGGHIYDLLEALFVLGQSPARFKSLMSKHQAALSFRIPAFRLYELRYIDVSDHDVIVAGGAGDGHVEPAFPIS